MFRLLILLVTVVAAVGCGNDTPAENKDDMPLAPYTTENGANNSGNDYIPQPPGRKTSSHIVAAPTAQLFIGKWTNKSELCNLEVRENLTCVIRCTDPDATQPDDNFAGVWSIEGSKLVIELQREWWHGKIVRLEYDDQQQALYKVFGEERLFAFDKAQK